MIFTPTRIAGVHILALEPIADERGWFARSWCAEQFARHGLCAELAQCNLAWNHRRGTLRGLHFQAPPYAEAKLVRVTRGAVFDVAVDVQPESPTFGQWVSVELTADNHLALFIPSHCAHGLQTLSDDTEVLYQMSTPYVGGAAQGIRWDDSALNIPWPLEPTVLSDRDRSWPEFAARFSGAHARAM